MSDSAINKYGSQGVNYETQVLNLTKDFAAGKISITEYAQQLKALELAELQKKSDVDTKHVNLEPPSDKALGDLKGLGLEALLQFITGENRTSQLKSAESRIENNKQEKEANYQQTMDKINEAIKKAEEEKESGWWKKAFGWLANIVTAVLSVAAIVVGAMHGNVALVAAGVAGLYFLSSSITEQVTGKGLTTRMLEPMLKAFGMSDTAIAITGMAIDAIGGIIAGICTGNGLAHAAKLADIGTKVAIFCARLSYGGAFLNGLSAVGTGAAGIANAVYKYDGAMLKADELELKKALEKLLIEDQETQKAIKAILEFFQKMTEDAAQVVKDKAQAQINVMSMAPTGGMA